MSGIDFTKLIGQSVPLQALIDLNSEIGTTLRALQAAHAAEQAALQAKARAGVELLKRVEEEVLTRIQRDDPRVVLSLNRGERPFWVSDFMQDRRTNELVSVILRSEPIVRIHTDFSSQNATHLVEANILNPIVKVDSGGECVVSAQTGAVIGPVSRRRTSDYHPPAPTGEFKFMSVYRFSPEALADTVAGLKRAGKVQEVDHRNSNLNGGDSLVHFGVRG